MLRQYQLVERVRAYDPDADEGLLNRAYVFTVQKHGSQKRASGDPYFSHPVEVAGILTELHLDVETIVTALLHDTLEDTLTTHEEIERLFGSDVARLVDGVTKLSKIEAQTENERAAENLRKFLLAMSDDIRVLLVKLADRLHNMRTLHFISKPEKRRRIARETMDIYAPLAERIGMYEFMREMQLLAFRELEPEAYATITGRLEKLTSGGKAKIAAISQELKELLAAQGIDAEISGREKHPYSIWRKMQERHVSFDQVTDIIAFRAITSNTAQCYAALGVIHQKWKMVPGRFKDYISTPKRNGYKSLHTTIMHQQNMRIEIQIRSEEMHQLSEYGLAAHWAYKQGGAQPDGQAGWIRDLLEILETSSDPDELLENTRMAMYQDRIFAFTPKGSLHQLPKGATPVDFAYAVHTDLGDRTVGSKVNGRLVPLRTALANGDTVEILVSDKQTPQPAWLGFAVTAKARAAIRRHVRSKEKIELAALGRKLYEELTARLPNRVGDKARTAALTRLKMDSDSALYIALARRQLSDNAVLEALVPGVTSDVKFKAHNHPHGVLSIEGLTPGVAYHLAKCCHPVPGDRIVGLSRPNEGITVHVIDCESLADGGEAEWIDLRWQEDSGGGSARLIIVVHNEPGTLAEMSGILAANGANITNLRLSNREGDFHTYDIVVEVSNLQHVMRIISALRASDAVAQAERL
ncbi:RelA/SpoT family protein [Sphingopyxis yananensis]|uniref:RelA/SpoT family protein n=1 Tax=Sphingopyxis yananensis TaxID=2886687 RepID=UPI001D11BCC8|nr:bifunctional (p)ppGpp synthetase/guanosine-3',5'-bis(diphosphate) 3'-pyrophosphohydrolase [Sphingopyxis yananensis]MCC2601653.1 bifunctional (p)ppGpp synthetase/guanosine-3',5'-bis(diphosphate) 3'-pyrophosphohydrolase [Sphingopyxis yananensis]